MYPQPDLPADDKIGDFDDLLKQLDTPADKVVVDGGYASLLARIASEDYRRRAFKRAN